MAASVNCCSSVDRNLPKRAKVIAAKTDTSINALFNAGLRYLVETCQSFKTLLDFSLARAHQ